MRAWRLIVLTAMLAAGGAAAYFGYARFFRAKPAAAQAEAASQAEAMAKAKKAAEEQNRRLLLQNQAVHNPSRANPAADVQRTLQTLEDINRINRMNQDMSRQRQQSKP
jgi:uncharacterized membrane protein YebE (DUF533 family)